MRWPTRVALLAINIACRLRCGDPGPFIDFLNDTRGGGPIGGPNSGDPSGGGPNNADYMGRDAPTQVSPGTRTLFGERVSSSGRVEQWIAHYDEFGRPTIRNDYNAPRTPGVGGGGRPVPSTHHHLFDNTSGNCRRVRQPNGDPHWPGEHHPGG